MRAITVGLATMAAAILATAIPQDADAGGIRRLRSNYEPGEVITARSHYGNGVVQSVVRRGRYGWQVRLPRGGSWVDCRRSCEETLRVQTVDIFGDGTNSLSNGGYGTLANECGIFGCLHWEYSF